MDFDPEQSEAAAVLVKVESHLTLDCVVGQPEAIKILRKLVDQIQFTSLFERWGIEKPKALALTGPPGVGKTLSIRALANEVNCPLMELKYEDIASHLYDESIRRLAAFKDQAIEIAKIHGHIIILIDEGDIFFQNRSDSNTHNSDVKKTSFFLRWLDGDLEGTQDLTLVVTSNNWEVVDPAIKRPGRFFQIEYKTLTKNDIIEAFKVHLDLFEKRTDRKLFNITNLSSINFDIGELSGADVKAIIEVALGEKAQEHLALIQSSVDLSALPLEEAMLLNSPSLIDNKDLEKALKIYTDKLDSQGLKGIGF
jgi:ATP-dependent 26S proteasome regulatory subunit